MKIVVFSQEKTLNIGLNYSPVFNNYNFVKPIYDEFGRETTYEYSSKYNYSTGISLEYIKKIYWGVDLNYTTKGYILEYNFISLSQNDPAIPIKSTVEAGYLDFNIKIGYNYNWNKKISIIPNIKLIYSGLINDRITTLSGDNNEYTSKEGAGILIKQDLAKSIFSSGIGINVKVSVLKSLSIGIEPQLLYSFNNISEKAIQKNTPIYAVKIGVYYKINKDEE